MKLVVRPLSRRLNIIGLLLFALVTSLVSVAVLAKGRLLGFDGSGTKTFEVPVAAASALGTVPDALLPPHRERVVGDE